ncbi:MAG: CPBP family intramembrane metalloprotease [Cryomorphaceae bacterium MED-G14]|nr:MAG: CPBP family intramembrane metalloprotease [Cryomorphaceae bacterium MED-G14]|tara:strand:- start:1612 stop:2490 length:879 start_codon:yes stop_codon:yes gene_type:complete
MSQSIIKKGWFRVVIVIPAFFFFAVIFQLLGVVASTLLSGLGFFDFSIQDLDSFSNLPAMTIIQYFDLMGIFILLWLFMKYVDKEPFMNMGFEIKGKRNDIILGMTLGLFMMAVGYLVLSSLGEIQFLKINYELSSIIWLFILFIGVSILEETFVRGYVLKNLLKSFNPIISLVISSGIFSLLHFLNPNVNYLALTELFIGGIALGISYVYTKNLWFPFAFHLSWNFFQVIFGFNVSGMDTYSLIEFEILEPNSLNGGDFGFEGSYLSIIFTIIIIYFLNNYYKKFKIKNPE